jgi:hypothetical protein
MDLVRPPTSTSSGRAAAWDPELVGKTVSSRGDRTATVRDQSRREDFSVGLSVGTGAGGISRQATRAAELRELWEAIATARVNLETEARLQQEAEDEKLLAAAREELRQLVEATAELRARRLGGDAIQPRMASAPTSGVSRVFSPITGRGGRRGSKCPPGYGPRVGRAMDHTNVPRSCELSERIPDDYWTSPFHRVKLSSEPVTHHIPRIFRSTDHAHGLPDYYHT